MPVAAVPHIHTFQQRFRFCFKLRCHRMAVLQFVQDGACEELELRLLKDEQHLLLQLLWILRLSEKHYPAAGGAVKSCNQLADGRFAAAVCAHKADDLMLTDGKADTREGISGLPAVCIADI